jgi:hypothetical protein
MMTERMVVMANQIAANVPDRAHASQQTAAHLTSFWAPSMIAALRAYAYEHEDELSAEVHEALAIMEGRA